MYRCKRVYVSPQNVLVATRDGIVESLLANPGDTLSNDQPIIGFEAEAA